MPRANKIYVQIDINASVDDVWQRTQTPEQHQLWDLRFTEIRYLPRPDPDKPQKFLYATRIGFGLDIRGEGESVGNFDGKDGVRSSALKFWSDDPKSLILRGSGYWKYVPTGLDSTRFLTLYDYDVRFGSVGRVFDRLVFRPLIGWATAWSFDRLRIWIETGIHPASSMRQSIAHAVARFGVAFVWIYQGLVPKLIFHHPDELKMLRAVISTDTLARRLCTWIGLLELGIGLTIIIACRSQVLLWFTLLAMLIAAVVVALKSPEFLTAAFNPIALNFGVFALAAVALLTARDLPTASRCVRRQPQGQE